MTNPTETRRLSFEYWSDPLCIWAYVAQPRLDRILERYGDRLDVRYHVVPVFGSVPWRFREGSWKKSGVEGRVAATARVAAQFGYTNITGEVWRDNCPASSWAPGIAITSVFALEEQGELAEGSGAAYQWAIRRAFFEDNRNVARRSVQFEVAESLGIPRAPIERFRDDGSGIALLWEEDQLRNEMKIQGSPTYVFDGGRARLFGNFKERVLQSTIAELLEDLDSGGSAC